MRFVKTKRTTIKEVAEKAGTSIATVSRVLSDTQYVSPELKEKVLDAIKDLDYFPNAIARSLRRDQTHTIGVVISDIANPFFSAVVRGIEDTLIEAKYMPLLCNTDRDIKKEEMYLHFLCEKQVDGVIISAAGRIGDHFEILRERGIPWVFVNRRPINFTGPAVLTDNVAGAFDAAIHLAKSGHKHIGTIAGPQDINTGVERLRGFREALSEMGLTLPDSFVKHGDFLEESGHWAAKELLVNEPRPTALFVANNQMTIGTLKALMEAGLKIPEDMALVAFDETEWSRIVAPPLTTVAQRTYEMGQAAAEMILNEIASGAIFSAEQPSQEIYLKPQLVVRESSGAFPCARSST